MIDLHIHSTASDGTYTPSEIVTYAKAKGLFAIALTDHDTVSGVKACMEAGLAADLKVISGIELSAFHQGLEVHILGYNIPLDDDVFSEALATINTNRHLRNKLILEKLQALGLDLTMVDLNPKNHPSPIFTRAHFASALLQKGMIGHRQEAFDRYLNPGKPAYVPKHQLLAADCIGLIHAAGGKAILAHPTLYKLSKVRIFNLIHQLVALGLDGVECIYPSYTPSQTRDFRQFCKRHHLLCSGGSDFHGANKPTLDLGTGYGHLQVPDYFLDDLLLSQ